MRCESLILLSLKVTLLCRVLYDHRLISLSIVPSIENCVIIMYDHVNKIQYLHPELF